MQREGVYKQCKYREKYKSTKSIDFYFKIPGNLSNAFKFTLEGGKICLELKNMDNTLNSSKTWVSIEVSDTGIGIPEDRKEKIFKLFFQNTTVASILNQGTGIGLSITKEFVKMHGGTIDVESEPGKGTTFIIRLPFIALKAPQISSKALPEKTGLNTESEQVEKPKEESTETELLKNQTECLQFY